MGDLGGDCPANLLEFWLGTDPNGMALNDETRLPWLRVESATAGGFQAVFEFHQPAARTGVDWTVQASTTLVVNDWQDLTHGVEGVAIVREGDLIRVTLPLAKDESRRFLRLRVMPAAP